MSAIIVASRDHTSHARGLTCARGAHTADELPTRALALDIHDTNYTDVDDAC